MQTVIETPAPSPTVREADAPRAFVVTYERLAYTLIIAAALLLRLAELDSVPLAASELQPALAAYRAAAVESSGAALVSDSPLNLLLQGGMFALFGGSELAARLPVALAGVLVVLLPLAFRHLLGAGRALALSIILLFSPVLLAASKFSDPAVYSALLAGLGLWALWRFYTQAGMQARYGVLAIGCFVGLILLSEPGGVVFAVILLIAGILTLLWGRAARDPLDEPEAAAPRVSIGALPWGIGLAVALFVTLMIATGFMLHPSGLGAVSQVIGGAVRGLVEPSPYSTAAYPLAVALFYEPFVLVLAIAAVVVRARRGLTWLDRFLIAWAVAAVVVAALYAGGEAAHALWVTLPLSVLAAGTLVEAMRPESAKIFMPAPGWARWVVALACIAVLAILTLAVQSVARSMTGSLDGFLMSVSPEPDSLVILLVSVMFLFIGYFLFASLWGSLTAAQGMVLGVAIFGLVTSLGAGWNAAVFRAESPTKLYHLRATQDDTHLLRETLHELTLRNTRGFNELAVVAVAPQDDVIAWMLRDYPNARFVNSIDDARGAGVLLAPAYIADPQLGGAYLGQTFNITRSWTNAHLRPVDFLAWWTQNHLPNREGIVQEDYVLWLRQDIYNGISPEQSGVVG